MRTVLLASLRTHARRYVAAVVAVVVAVGFVVATNAIGSATKAGVSAGVAEAYRGSDLVVADDGPGLEPGAVERILRVAERQGGAAAVLGSSSAPVALDGVLVGADTSIGTVSTDPALRRQDLVSGVAPTRDDQALVDERTARSARISVGDDLRVGTGSRARDVEVLGIARATSYLAADVYVTWPTLSSLPGSYVDAVAVRTDGDPGPVRTALESAVGAPVSSTSDYVDARLVSVNQGVDVIGVLLLLFAAVAGFVAVLVISNTFTILFAQRTRDLALLRCVGATRRQVLRSVRAESLAVALVASTIGVVAGAGAGYGIAAAVRAWTSTGTLGPVSISPVWVVAAFLGGVVVTVAAAWLPTRRVVRVTPLAALRPLAMEVRSRAGVVRVAAGLTAVTGGSGALAAATQGRSLPLLLVGGMVSFVGVLLLGPLLVPALVRLAGRLLGGTGLATRLAAANAVRNPRRSAATTASLLVGVTLATAVLTGMASARGALDVELDEQYPVDVALTSTGPLPARALATVRGTSGVDEAAAVPGLRVDLEGAGDVTALAPDAAARRLAPDPGVVSPQGRQVLIPVDVASQLPSGVPETVTLRAGGREVRADAVVVGSEWGPAVLASPDVIRGLGGRLGPQAVWVRADGGADAARLTGDLGAVGRDLDLGVTSSLDGRGYVQRQLDVLTWSVLGLLAISVGIALVGIANTVGLSVLERGREHALLRALGLTRRQLRRMLAAEGLLLALVAAVLGTAVGVTFGWVGTLTVVRSAVSDVQLVTPWGQLALVVGGAALAGLLACVAPARRAARVTPAEGLVLD
jgi:putative ABC transport system permease protein